MAHIYVSSTFQDLKEYREQVRTALRSMNHDDQSMEYYGASDERPVDKCLRDVEKSDLYIGIFALRYGFVPPGYNRSITELEYRRAREKNIPCLIFLADEDKWPFGLVEKAALSKITDLREELKLEHIIDFFYSTDDIKAKVFQAVRNWEINTGQGSKVQIIDWDVYRQAVGNRHQWVRLQVIAGASKERSIVRIPLMEIFEPQLLSAGVSINDLPEDVRKYQKLIYSSYRQTLEEPVSSSLEVEITENSIEPEINDDWLSANPELVIDIIGRERQQVILGGPGSGKSTILQYAMLQVSQTSDAPKVLPVHLQTKPISFLIDLRNYVLQKEKIQDLDFAKYIIQNSKEYYGLIVSVESLVNLLEQNGQAIVFFDGLDEVFDLYERRRVIDQFQIFAHRYPKVYIIVTSRISGYDRAALGLADFKHYTLLPLTVGQIAHFANNWYQFYGLERTERSPQGLVQRIIENPRLLDLAGNPMLLTMMAVVYKNRDLPNERWRLYERCAETLLEDWDLSKGIKEKDFNLSLIIRTAQKSEILQRVSVYMLDHRQKGRELNAIGYVPLLDIVASYLEEKYQRSRGDAEAVAVEILRHLMERTYVLAGIGERVFGFVHRTFMEYFAACRYQALFNASKSDFNWLTKDLFGVNWEDEAWEEVLLLLIAMLNDQGTPIREVVEYLRNMTKMALPLNLTFAVRCLGEAGGLQDPLYGQEIITDLAQNIAVHAYKSRKVSTSIFVDAAIKAFSSLAPLLVKTPAAIQDAIDLLKTGNNSRARMTAWQMEFALLSRKDRLNYALEALQDTQDIVRRSAILALEREWPGRADIGPVLANILRNDPLVRVRQVALSSIKRSWRNEPEILNAIESRADQEIGYSWIIQLIEYLAYSWPGNIRARDLIIRLAGPKVNANVRWEFDYDSVYEAAFRALKHGWDDFLIEQALEKHDLEQPTTIYMIITRGS